MQLLEDTSTILITIGTVLQPLCKGESFSFLHSYP